MIAPSRSSAVITPSIFGGDRAHAHGMLSSLTLTCSEVIENDKRKMRKGITVNNIFFMFPSPEDSMVAVSNNNYGEIFYSLLELK